MTNLQYEQLESIMENTWGDDEEVLDALIEFLGGNFEEVKSVLEKDRTFNRYTCDICSWSELAYSIAYDEAWEEDDIDDTIEFLRANHENEEACKDFLIKQNWCISKDHSVAIGFDDDVIVTEHEVERDII